MVTQRSAGQQIVGARAAGKWEEIPKRAAQAQAVDNDYLLRTVIESLNDGVIVTDLDNRVLHANSRLAKLVGCSAAEMIGQPAYDFLSLIEG
jgi:PAS domain-containing protein